VVRRVFAPALDGMTRIREVEWRGADGADGTLLRCDDNLVHDTPHELNATQAALDRQFQPA
jgi:hypothetical protein